MHYIVKTRLIEEKSRLQVLYAESGHTCFQGDPVKIEQIRYEYKMNYL